MHRARPFHGCPARRGRQTRSLFAGASGPRDCGQGESLCDRCNGFLALGRAGASYRPAPVTADVVLATPRPWG